MLKVQWDAAQDCNNKKMGLGVVVRNYAGEVQVALSTTVHYIIDPSVAEVLVIWKVVSFCCDLGLQHVIFEGNSMQVVSALNKDSPCWSNFSNLIEDSNVLLKRFESFVVRHTCRAANQASHRLAKTTLS